MALAFLSMEVISPLVAGIIRRKMEGPSPGIFINKLSRSRKLIVTISLWAVKRPQSGMATVSSRKSFLGMLTQLGRQFQWSIVISGTFVGGEALFTAR